MFKTNLIFKWIFELYLDFLNLRRKKSVYSNVSHYLAFIFLFILSTMFPPNPFYFSPPTCLLHDLFSYRCKPSALLRAWFFGQNQQTLSFLCVSCNWIYIYGWFPKRFITDIMKIWATNTNVLRPQVLRKPSRSEQNLSQ